MFPQLIEKLSRHEDLTTDEAAGAKTAIAEYLGQRDLIWREVEPAVVADTMPGRERARHERTVRWQRERN